MAYKKDIPHLGTAFGPRIVVVGASGSGKTTLSRQLASALSVKHIELDALVWEDARTRRDFKEVLRILESEMASGSGWINDGDYGEKIRYISWPKADFVLWLDFPLRTIISRFIFTEILNFRQYMNPSTGYIAHFRWKFGKIVRMFFQTRQARRDFSATSGTEWQINLVRFTSPRELRMWMEGPGWTRLRETKNQ